MVKPPLIAHLGPDCAPLPSTAYRGTLNGCDVIVYRVPYRTSMLSVGRRRWHPEVIEQGATTDESWITVAHVDHAPLVIQGKAGLDAAMSTLVEVATALCQAHDAGIYHGDLAWDVVGRRPDGGLVITRLGLLQAFRLDPNAMACQPRLRAPEVRERGYPVVGASDVYSCGAMLREAVALAFPDGADLPGEFAELIQASTCDEEERIDLAALVRRLREAQRALEAWDPPADNRPTLPVAIPIRVPRNRPAPPVLMVGVCALVLGIALALSTLRRPEVRILPVPAPVVSVSAPPAVVIVQPLPASAPEPSTAAPLPTARRRIPITPDKQCWYRWSDNRCAH
jgi:hypothetical protein